MCVQNTIGIPRTSLKAARNRQILCGIFATFATWRDFFGARGWGYNKSLRPLRLGEIFSEQEDGDITNLSGLCDLARVIRGKGMGIEQIIAGVADWRDFSWQGDEDRTNLSESGAWQGGFRGWRTVIDAVKGYYSRGVRFVKQIQIRRG